MELLEILNAKKYDTDKHTVHAYIQEYYEQIFFPYKNKITNLLEIGVLKGESLKLWRDYFSKGEIVGIDIFKRVSYEYVSNNLKGLDIQLDMVDSFQDDLFNINNRNNFIEKYQDKKFDIIIDDGLHTGEAQYKSFKNFSSLVNKGGVYVIEDVRDESVEFLSQINNIKFLHLSDKSHPLGKQYIAEIKF